MAEREAIEPDYASAAEAWLALTAMGLGLEFQTRVRQLALDFHHRLLKELEEATTPPAEPKAV